MKKIFIKNRLIEALVLLIPILLISGPFLSDLSIILCCILFFFAKEKVLVKLLWKNNLIKTFFLFYLYIIFCSLIIPVADGYFVKSFIPSFFYIRFLIFVIVFYFIFHKNRKFSLNLFYVLLFILIILFIDINLEYFLKRNILGHNFNGVRIQSLFKDEWIVGSYISYIIPLVISLFFINKKKRKFIIFNIKYDENYIFIILLISVFLVLLSGERSALFSTLLYSFLITLFLNFNLKKKIIFFGIIIFIFSISLSFLKPTYERVFKHTLQQLNIYSPNYKKDHQLIFETGLKVYIDNKIFGSGLKGFRNQCQKEKYYIKGGCTTHPHNFYIQFLSELGFIGFSFLSLSFLILSLIIFFRIKKFYFFNLNKKIFNNEIMSILIGLYVYLFPFKTHGSFFNNWLSICFYLQFSLLIAIYLGPIKKKITKIKKNFRIKLNKNEKKTSKRNIKK
jgi:O-antigen ligase